ncbi:hypothetical protein Tco_0791956 [Tanacetum coccineum]
MSIRALLAKERILKLIQDWDEKKIKSWSLPELLLQLLNDSQTINESLKQREEKRIETEQAANQLVHEEQEEPVAQSFLLNWNFVMADDDEYIIIYRSSKAITPDLPTEEPDNSLSMGDEHLNTISKTESDKLIKSSVENLFPIPSESKSISDDIYDVPFCDNDHFDAEFGLINSLLSRDISITSPKIDFLPEEFAGELDLIDLPTIHSKDTCGSDSENVLPSCEDFSPIFEEKFVTFSNPLFDSNDDFSDDESLSDEDVLEDLEGIKCKASYDSNLDESTFLVTPLSYFNEDECFTPSDDVELLLHRDSSTPMISDDIDENRYFLGVVFPTQDIEDGYHDSEGDIHYLESLLSDNTTLSLPPKDCPDFEGSRARCFVHRSLALQILSMLILGIRYP